MPQSNDSILVTPGSGATVATHNPGDGKEYQVVMVADPNGQLQKSNPIYRLIVPPQAVGANKVHADLFNATGTGKVMRILSAFCFVNLDTAVTGTVGLQISLTRTTSVGMGGTAATNEGTSVTAPAISRLDTSFGALPSGVTARASPTGVVTAGALLATRYMFTEETNAGSAVAAALCCEFVRDSGAELIVRENGGIRFVQGPVASVGTIGFEVTFELV